MRAALASVLVAAASFAIVVAGTPSRGTPLWAGARYTIEERDRAVLRGLGFIYRCARRPEYFREWGHDLLGAFYNIAETSSGRDVRDLARRMGRERSVEWRRIHPGVPPGTDPEQMKALVFGNDSAERLGVPDPTMRAALTAAAARFSAADYLGFDPAVEPPPADFPKPCEKCGRQNRRGSTVCSRCGSRLEMYSRYDLYQDALIDTYWGERSGIRLGAPYADVLQWLPWLRPWPARRPGNEDEYYAGVYAITHVIYTYNGYSVYRVSPACFPQEFEYLKDNLRDAIADRDPETMGEYLDTLRAFGLTFADGVIRQGFEYLLSVQNPDGSWGDPKADPYGRYHPTWTSVDGLRDYRWSRVLPCPPLAATPRPARP